MSIEEQEYLEHLYERKKLYVQRLRELEKRQAQYGSSTPPEVNTEVREIKTKVSQISSTIKQIENPPEDAEHDESPPFPLEAVESSDSSGVFFFLVIVCIGIAFVIASCVSSANKVLTEDFNQSAGLGSWRTNGDVTVIADNHEISNTKVISGAVQLKGSESYLFHVLSDKTDFDTLYTGSVWCKAPIGSRCRIFIGSLQEGLSRPISESDNTIPRDGTGRWESMAVTVSIPRETKLALFLYAEGAAESVLYDEVRVTK